MLWQPSAQHRSCQLEYYGDAGLRIRTCRTAASRRNANGAMTRAKGGVRKFEPSKLTSILKSALFRHYHYMMILLKLTPRRLMGWFDSCPCHDFVLALEGTRHHRQEALRREGLTSGTCPLCSCRVWEVIDGELDSVITSLGNQLEFNLTEAIAMKEVDGLTGPLTSSDYALIIGNFQSGIVYLQLGFGIRLSWSKHLPWMLLALPHPDARRGVH